MDKIKELFKRYRKIIIIILILLFLLILFLLTNFFGLLNRDRDSARVGNYNLEEMDDLTNPEVFTDGNFLTTFGKVSNLEDQFLFTLETEAISFSVYLYDLETNEIKVSVEGISNGDYVAVEGFWNKSYNALLAEKVVKLDSELVENYLASKIPTLEIEILEYPENVYHTCETIKVELRLTNTGQLPIVRSEMFKEGDERGSLYGYGFFHILNNNPQLGENYDEPDGILAVHGVKEFEVINPGQSVDVTYYAGGLVTESLHRDMFNDDGSHRRSGVGGSPNILGNEQKGDHTVSFAWGEYYYGDGSGWKSYNYATPRIQFETEEITINLIDDNCDLSNPTNIFWIEPL